MERVRHAFRTAAPEPAREAGTKQSTKGQEAPLKQSPSFEQESGEPAQNNQTWCTAAK